MAQDAPPNTLPQGGGGGSNWGWLGAVASVVGSAVDWLTQRSSNTANARNVDKQIAFQKEQSETQYQRGVADLSKAGLNPALAYQKGGNTAEGGAAAQNQPSRAGQSLQAAVEAYNQFANGTAQRQLIREQAAATNAQAVKTIKEAQVIEPDAALGRNTGWIDEYGRTKMARNRGDKYVAEKVPEQWEANLAQTKQGTATAAAQAKVMESQATLNEQEYMNVWFRKNIAPYINSTARAAKGMYDLGTIKQQGRSWNW